MSVVLIMLLVLGFAVGFTHNKSWSVIGGIQGALICLFLGILTSLIIEVVEHSLQIVT